MKRINVAIAITVVFFVLFLSACGTSKRDLSCAKIKVTSCNLDSYGGYVYGTVINNCPKKISALEITASVYNSNGLLLSEDKEYVENLAVGGQATFKAVMDQAASGGQTCKAKITNGY
jgi:hypothetical protein